MSHQQLIETPDRCTAYCNYCAVSCLDEDEVVMLTDCIKLNLDCAEVC